MGKKWSHKKIHSIFFKTFCPLLLILLLIVGLYTLTMKQKLLVYLKDNASEFFNEQVERRLLYVENEMTNHWAAVSDGVSQIVRNIETTAENRGTSLDTIKTDSALNQTILSNVMDDMLGTLRTCGATDIFLILDGESGAQGGGMSLRPGIYLRNSSPEYYSGNNQSILFERGMPSLSKKWKISLDTFWSAHFTFGDESDPNSFYYTKPLTAAKEGKSRDPGNLAYWGFGKPLSTADMAILTYSLPLIASDGTILGVMGVGINESQFAESIDYRELSRSGEQSGAYVLAHTVDGINYVPVIFNGVFFDKSSFLNHPFTIREADTGISYLYPSGQTSSDLCVSKKRLKLYNHNTPFEQEQWYLLGIQNESELLTSYNTASRTLVILAAGAILISLGGVYWTSLMLSRPISRLIVELRQSDPNQPIRLQRVNTSEIDELALSVESLSDRVAAAFSKISTIVQMAESGIGVFEYKEQENLVFCSRSFYEMLGWKPVIDSNAYIDGTEFFRLLKLLERNLVPGEKDLLEIPKDSGETQWFKLNQIRDGQSILGVLTNVTAAVLEKHQIEYERDYDTLTNLYNRRGFEERINSLFQKPQLLGFAAYLVWDLDNLKFVNDSYGHTSGDGYITAFSACLREFCSKNILSARRSGDEFITFLYGFEDSAQADEIVKKIWEEVGRATVLLPDKSQYKVRVSAGMARYPEDSTDSAQLFQYADFAMYTAKHNHKGMMEYFNNSLYNKNKILLHGQAEFLHLLDEHLVRYMLQPIITAGGEIYGYEMLMRSDVELFRSPYDILRMAQTQFKLYDVEVMTWFEAMKTFVQMSECGLIPGDSKVFINSIANQLMKPEMVQLFSKTYAAYLPRIVCEFTEEYQSDKDTTTEKCRIVKEWNAMLAIDDYGCGYNNESTLIEVAPGIVKIDISIVRGIHNDPDRRQLVKNLLQYTCERNILVLGEGVETKEEIRCLMELGVELFQGYYVARPSFDGSIQRTEVFEEIRLMYQNVKGKNQERRNDYGRNDFII